MQVSRIFWSNLSRYDRLKFIFSIHFFLILDGFFTFMFWYFQTVYVSTRWDTFSVRVWRFSVEWFARYCRLKFNFCIHSFLILGSFSICDVFHILEIILRRIPFLWPFWDSSNPFPFPPTAIILSRSVLWRKSLQRPRIYLSYKIRLHLLRK